jgi:hypothetical protein
MIKLILIVFLSLALSESVYAKKDNAEELSEFDPNCQIAGSVKVKLSINVPPGACGCPSEEESTDLCLGLENSKKISDAVLNVLAANGNSWDVISSLQIHKFMSGMDYTDFANNIKSNDFEFEGFSELKDLVTTYRICKKECKVYFTLRKSLRENSADAETKVFEEGDLKELIVDGDLIILSDIIKEIQEQIVKDIAFTKVTMKAKTFIADALLPGSIWHGKTLRIEATNFLVASKTVAWDVTGCEYG